MSVNNAFLGRTREILTWLIAEDRDLTHGLLDQHPPWIKARVL